MRTVIIMLALCFFAHTTFAQTVPTAAKTPTFKQALRVEDIRFSKEWHKRLYEINYDTNQKKAKLKKQYIVNYHSTQNRQQRLAYKQSYDSQVKSVVKKAKEQWTREFAGLEDGHNYNVEQIYKSYGYTYTAPAK